MGRRRSDRLACLFLAGLTSVWITSATAQTQTAPPRCDDAEFRRFDYWVGDWEVTAGGGRAGTNLVTLEEDGCVIHEHWKGARGGTGQSFTHNPDRTVRQYWETSADSGKTWTPVFDGLYRKRA